MSNLTGVLESYTPYVTHTKKIKLYMIAIQRFHSDIEKMTPIVRVLEDNLQHLLLYRKSQGILQYIYTYYLVNLVLNLSRICKQ